jgi:hypothetical protein
MVSVVPPTVAVAVCTVAVDGAFDAVAADVGVMEATGLMGGVVATVEVRVGVGAAAAAVGVDVEPPVEAMATPPTTAATDNPTMAIVIRGCLIVPRFWVG